MSYLAQFAAWRAIVHATKDRRKLVLYSVGACAAFGGMAYTTQRFTDQYSKANEDAVRKYVKKDREAARYAKHSKNALQVVLAEAEGKAPPEQKHPIKMPQVHWHPGALRRAEDAKPTQSQPSASAPISPNAQSSAPTSAPRPVTGK